MAEALERLGRFDKSIPIRRRSFESTLSEYQFQLWLGRLPKAAPADTEVHPRQIANRHQDQRGAAKTLIQLDEAPAAEARLVAEAARTDGRYYGRLVPLAKSLGEHDRSGDDAVVYRTLLWGTLDWAYVRAYGHAARCLARLG